jgi:hypothetical protein
VFGFALSGCDDFGDPSESETPPPPLPKAFASGGEVIVVSYVAKSDPSKGIYETHVFKAGESQNESLTFPPDTGTVVYKVDYLVVAGGGGAGNTNSLDGSGGGAGGLLYVANTSLQLKDDGSVTVTVGKGGAGGAAVAANVAAGLQGANGGNSVIETISETISVLGGGGGAGAGGTGASTNGKAGGSGGGGGAGSYAYRGSVGTATASGNVLGHAGGLGGGGGGAGGVGGSSTPDSVHNSTTTASSISVAGAGGAGWKPLENNAAWVKKVTGTEEFSHGGAGGKNCVTDLTPADDYGDGGEGSSQDRSGHDGIVVIRFFREADGTLPTQ